MGVPDVRAHPHHVHPTIRTSRLLSQDRRISNQETNRNEGDNIMTMLNDRPDTSTRNDDQLLPGQKWRIGDTIRTRTMLHPLTLKIIGVELNDVEGCVYYQVLGSPHLDYRWYSGEGDLHTYELVSSEPPTPRYGELWTEDDLAQLVISIAMGSTVERAAEKLGRTKGSCAWTLHQRLGLTAKALRDAVTRDLADRLAG